MLKLNTIKPYHSEDSFELYNHDCVEVLQQLQVKPRLVFADPPYFLSNGGQTIKSGKITSVNKGDWDKLPDGVSISEFNHKWLSAIRDIMPEDGTIFISGTYHNFPNLLSQLNDLGFKVLNVIVWEKTNPPPNFSKKFFTHSSELIIWARKSEKTTHYYDYDLMKALNDDKPMKDVWRLPAIPKWEKQQGKHPTQKPLSVLSRIILAASEPGDVILDPFAGSCTTGIAANLLGRNFIGIDIESDYLDVGIKRKAEMDQTSKETILAKIKGLEYFINHTGSGKTGFSDENTDVA